MNWSPPIVRSGWSALRWWALSYLASNLASAVVVSVTGHADDDVASIPIWVTFVGALVLWSVQVYLFPLRVNPYLFQPIRRIREWFTARDFLRFIPLGIAGQLFLVNIVNWPLSKIWPDTFSFDEVSQRANDITSTAPGLWAIVLVVIVVIGAPVIEEIVYRGTLQPALESVAGRNGALLLTAALFAAIHLEPVELPGLFAFALVLGVVRQRTGRLGPAVITHMAFNSAGLVLVALT